MKLINSREGIHSYRESLKQTVGLVPTMGALHEGHLSLVKEASQKTELIIVSIFVNPTQFNDPNDLKNYPRTLDEDLKILASYNVNAVFVPGVHDIYPHPDTRKFNFGKLESVMEGKHRPGHFNGVAQVVSILFDLVKPHVAFFGQKDFQQLAIIRKLVDLLNLNIEIVSCPIVREPNGLAMSSRNRRLTEDAKKNASLVYKTLKDSMEKKNKLDPPELAEWAKRKISNHPELEVEYFEVVNTIDLQPVKKWTDSEKQIACVAVKINDIRLIDNMIFP